MEPPPLPLEPPAEETDGPDLGLDRHREISALMPGLYLGSVAIVCVLVVAVPRFGFAPLAVLGPSLLIAIAIERMSPATAAGVQGSIVSNLVWFLELGVVIVISGGPTSFAVPWIIAPCLIFFLRQPTAKATRLAWLGFGMAMLPLVVVDPPALSASRSLSLPPPSGSSCSHSSLGIWRPPRSAPGARRSSTLSPAS